MTAFVVRPDWVGVGGAVGFSFGATTTHFQQHFFSLLYFFGVTTREREREAAH